MRKLIILAASLVALAALIAIPFANAATTDANGVVTVTKGDIQSAMGWNNAKWDAAIRLANGVATVATFTTTTQHAGRRSGRLAHPERADRRQLPERRVLHQLVHQPGELVQRLPRSRVQLDGGMDTAVTPILNAQQKVTGYKVSAAPTADGFVYYTRHTTGTVPRVRRRHVSCTSPPRAGPQRRGSGVSDVSQRQGRQHLVTPYVAPAV